jgi:hypothetical protein
MLHKTTKSALILAMFGGKEALVQGCHDEKSFHDCLQAFFTSECKGNFNGCDRTCGKCSDTDFCYDVIPANTANIWSNRQVAAELSSEWPNWLNNGNNLFPKKKEKEDGLYDGFPFDNEAISDICLDIFERNHCDETDLIYTIDQDTITLSGQGFEYCRFTCGRCVSSDSCWNDHNNGIQHILSQV